MELGRTKARAAALPKVTEEVWEGWADRNFWRVCWGSKDFLDEGLFSSSGGWANALWNIANIASSSSSFFGLENE